MYDPNGTLIWKTEMESGLSGYLTPINGGVIGNLALTSIQGTADGGVIIAGEITAGGAIPGILIKMTPK